jgi:hypothetical protein
MIIAFLVKNISTNCRRDILKNNGQVVFFFAAVRIVSSKGADNERNKNNAKK